MGHSSRSSSSRHAQMTSAGASSPLCAPQKQSSTISMPVLGLHTPSLHHGTACPAPHRNVPEALQATRGLFVGSLRAGGEGGAVQKGHCSLLSCLAGRSIPVRSRCIPHLELAGRMASHSPRDPTPTTVPRACDTLAFSIRKGSAWSPPRAQPLARTV